MPPTPGLRGQGTSPGSPAGFLGSSGWGKCPPFLSCCSSLGGPLLPASPDLPGLPPMPPGPMWLGVWVGWGWLWRAGEQPGSSAGSLGQVGGVIALHPSSNLPGGPLLPASPALHSASFLWPQGPTQPGGGFGVLGIGLRSQQAP